jgi:hypothetical protein
MYELIKIMNGRIESIMVDTFPNVNKRLKLVRASTEHNYSIKYQIRPTDSNVKFLKKPTKRPK